MHDVAGKCTIRRAGTRLERRGVVWPRHGRKAASENARECPIVAEIRVISTGWLGGKIPMGDSEECADTNETKPIEANGKRGQRSGIEEMHHRRARAGDETKPMRRP